MAVDSPRRPVPSHARVILNKGAHLLLLLAVVLNGFVPSATRAAHAAAATAKTPASPTVAWQAGYQPPRLTRPTPRRGVRPGEARYNSAEKSLETLQAQDVVYDASLQCVYLSAFPCPDTTAGPVWKLTVAYTTGAALSHYTLLKIVCQGWGCPRRDIYYRTRVTYVWASRFYRQVYVGARVEAYFGTAEGAVSQIFCGSGNTGKCTIEAEGVLRANLITADPNATSHFNFYRGIAGIGTGDSLFQIWEMEAALDPRLLSSPIHDKETLFSCKVADPRECAFSRYAASQGFEGDPVNTRIGSFDYSIEDLAVQTSAGRLFFRRSYSSAATQYYRQPLGYGWTHNHETRLIFPGDPAGQAGFVLFKAHSANLYRFYIYGDGRYSPTPGISATLTRNAGPPVTYFLRTEMGETYLFNQDGRLLSWTDAHGHSFNYEYSAEDRLERVSADNGSRYLSFGYDEQGYLVSVLDHSGRSVRFTYDDSGNLISATDVEGQVWSYVYDAEHRLSKVIDPGGKLVSHVGYSRSISSSSPLNFNDYGITSFGSEDVLPSATLEDNGYTLHLTLSVRSFFDEISKMR